MTAPGKLLVTGANGFIGGVVTRAWLAAGLPVVAMVRSGWSGTLPAGFSVERRELSADNVCAVLDEAAPDVVLHAAGSSSVERSLRDPFGDYRDSVGTLHAVLEGIRLSKRRPRLLYPSSAAVYGEPDSLPIRETSAVAPVSPYGHHKAIGELLVREYATCFGVPALAFRLFSVFGPHQKRLLVSELYRQFTGAADVVTVEGTGQETRDFLHEDDMAAALLAIAGRLDGGFHAVNLATGIGTTVADLAAMCGRLLKSSKTIRCAGRERSGNPSQWIAATDELVRTVPNVKVGRDYDLEGRLLATFADWRQETR